MIGDYTVFGVFLPKLLVFALAAYAGLLIVKSVFARLGLYRLVWHPALFDLSIYILVFAATARAAPWYLS
ncbi:DUF1656 domain-containing protein [Jiella sonneratiae]|uniref:DUF1656 domain-containing protein n=1 Tax=Jiella sonneratiae TaxID=2816856 RepID=A0ABS3J5W4_9HYPH|nr:DUF1656 domain-containing protein [Jiella sonneratiae]MBO0905060.1 DUF1656 domain-containing protein [Jiella sonneratiae]